MAEKKIKDIANELVKPSLDLALDYSEIGLDEIFDNDTIKSLPVVKTIVGVVKTGLIIKERLFIKNFLTFLQEFHAGKLDEKKFEEFKNKFETDTKYKEKIIEQLLILIEETNSTIKSKILAHLFEAHINSYYDWDRFIELSECLTRLNIAAYPYLKKLSKERFPFQIKKLLDYNEMEEEVLLTSNGIAYRDGRLLHVTKLGQDLYNYGIKKVIS